MKHLHRIPGLTRRRFLEQLGAVGGSSLVMSAMSSWDLMAGAAGQRPQLSGRPASNTRILVLGAGLSGLVAAYELGKLGYDCRVLEARDRVGGLEWAVQRGSTHTEVGGERQVCGFDEGQYVNVGPWRIPYSHEGVLGYCRELGVPLQVFINEAENSYFYFQGAAAGPLANRRVRMREVRADLTGHINELLLKAMDQHALDQLLTAEDQERLKTFLVREGYLDSSTHAYKAFENRGEGDPYDLVALLQGGFGNRLRSVPAVEGTAAAPMFQPIGGMDQISKGFQRTMGAERITLNAEVQSVHQDDRGVKVVYRDTRTGKTTEVPADYVIVSMPLTIVSGLDINLSDDLMQAVKDVTYSNSAKIGLAMKRRFWEEDDHIFGGHLYSDLPIGEFSYPSCDYFTRKGVLLGLYSNGPIGNLIDQPIAERIEYVLTYASKVHPQIRTEFESGYAVFWKKVPYSLGGYASGRNVARRQRLSQVDNRIVIGSAATTPRSAPDWQEGAVAAGWQALESIHARAMRG
ncbi:MAG: flavin monoamine oxidase family protein [Acidobacteria bacterium]|nr:flavin monoamine oxidase family protein [Acidobacteriota bacterium]